MPPKNQNLSPSQKMISEIFESLDEATDALTAVAKFIRQKYSPLPSDRAMDISGFIISKIRVQFSPKLEEVEFETNYLSNIGTVWAPKIHGETKEEEDHRRISLIRYFAEILKDMQIRTTLHVFATLKPQAQKHIISNEKDSPEEK